MADGITPEELVCPVISIQTMPIVPAPAAGVADPSLIKKPPGLAAFYVDAADRELRDASHDRSGYVFRWLKPPRFPS